MGLLESAALALVPEAFREFVPYVSPSALNVIHRQRVLSLAMRSMLNTVNDAHYERVFSAVESHFLKRAQEGDASIRVVREIHSHQDWANFGPDTRKAIGEKILELYFTLLHSPLALHLDLRPKHFAWEENTLLWHPSRLLHETTPEFSRGIRQLYRGFFHEDPRATSEGLLLYAHDSKPREGFYERMELLMRQHFGDARSTDVHFSIDHFKKTFHLIFEEAIQSKARFHPELTLLGTALAGLYVSLEKTQAPLNVAKAYGNIAK